MMFKSLLTLLLLLIEYFPSITTDDNFCECGTTYLRRTKRKAMSNSRIFKGSAARLGRFPWQILITSRLEVYIGAGVLISKKHIVTCADYMQQLMRLKVLLPKEFSKVAMTNACRGKFFGVTIFSLKEKL